MKSYARPTGRPRARRALPALLLLPLLLVLAGCFRLDLGLTINSDDTLDVTMEMGDLTGFASREDMACSELESELVGGPNEDVVDFTVTDIEDDDGNVGCRMEATGAPLDTLADDGGMSVQRVDDTYVFSFEGDPAGLGDMSDLEDVPAGMEPQVSIAVTFPGEVIEADGEIDGNTVTWTGLTAFAEGGRATGEASGSGIGAAGDNTVTWIVLGVVILLAVAVLIFLLVKRSQAKSGPAQDAPYGAPAQDAAAPYGQAAPPHQAPADPGAGYPSQQPPAAPNPYTTAMADTPVARPEGDSFAPPEPATPQQPDPQAPAGQQDPPAGPEQQDPPAAPEEGESR